jgi:hypothetical protein
MSHPFRAASRSYPREFLKKLMNPKVHYSIHKNAPLVPVLGLFNPVHSILSLSLSLSDSSVVTFATALQITVSTVLRVISITLQGLCIFSCGSPSKQNK